MNETTFYNYRNRCHGFKIRTESATIALELTKGEAERLLVDIAKNIGIARTLAVVADAIDEHED